MAERNTEKADIFPLMIFSFCVIKDRFGGLFFTYYAGEPQQNEHMVTLYKNAGNGFIRNRSIS